MSDPFREALDRIGVPRRPDASELHDIMVAWYARPRVHAACEHGPIWSCARKVVGYTPLSIPEYGVNGYVRWARMTCNEHATKDSICYTRYDFPEFDPLAVVSS